MRNDIASLYAQTRIFAMRVSRATAWVEKALSTCSAWYVALSGGKDSTCVLALVREFQPDIPAVFSDDEWWLPETEAYLMRLKDAGVNLHWIRTQAYHTEWFAVEGKWIGIPDYARQHDWQGVFLGLRQEESGQRRLHLRRQGALFYAESDDFWHCNPLSGWSWKDVWAYIVSNDLDYNEAYDKLESMGIPPARQRIGPLAVERALGYGQLAILKRGWPELFNRFAAEFPEARSYV